MSWPCPCNVHLPAVDDMVWVGEGAPSVTRTRELDKGAATGLASEAVRGNADVGHVPVATEVAAEVRVAGAWCHAIYVQPPVYMQPAHCR